MPSPPLMRPVPLNVPSPAPLSVMVSVSVAPLLGSAIVTPENGWTALPALVGCAATVVPEMVGATAGSLSITVVVVLTVGVVQALLKSLSVKLWSCWSRGAGGRRESQRVEFAVDGRGRRRRQGVDAATVADEAGAAQRSVASAAERDGQRVGGAAVGSAMLTAENGWTALRRWCYGPRW